MEHWYQFVWGGADLTPCTLSCLGWQSGRNIMPQAWESGMLGIQPNMICQQDVYIISISKKLYCSVETVVLDWIPDSFFKMEIEEKACHSTSLHHSSYCRKIPGSLSLDLNKTIRREQRSPLCSSLRTEKV